MPKFGEPGMMMGEIPCLSEMIKSRAPRVRFRRSFHGRSEERPFDLYMLLMSGKMLTGYYGEKYCQAQGVILRKFLGILAQKVTGVRKEKAVAELAPFRLHIFCAGVSMKLVKETDAIIRSMMVPEFTDGYRIWADNKMVIIGDEINNENWEAKLLAEDAAFKHNDPYGDPGGYRAIMALLLADKFKAGLTELLMDHPGNISMEKSTGPFGNLKPAKYHFMYRSGAIASDKNFAELPDIMNLSNPALTEEYSQVNFAVDEKNTAIATPIAHALTIPGAALHKEQAKEFARMFLEIDKESQGFIPRDEIFGKDPIK